MYNASTLYFNLYDAEMIDGFRPDERPSELHQIYPVTNFGKLKKVDVNSGYAFSYKEARQIAEVLSRLLKHGKIELVWVSATATDNKKFVIKPGNVTEYTSTWNETDSQKTQTQNSSIITSSSIRVYKDKSLIDNTYLHFRAGQNFDHEHLLCYYRDPDHYEAYWLEKIAPNEFRVKKTYERMCFHLLEDLNRLYVDGKSNNIYAIEDPDNFCHIVYGPDDQRLFCMYLTCELRNYLGVSEIHHIRDQFYLLTILPPHVIAQSAIILCNGETAIFFGPKNSRASVYNNNYGSLNEIVVDTKCFEDVDVDRLIKRLTFGKTLNEMQEILKKELTLNI